MLGFALWTHMTSGKGVPPNPVEAAAVLAALAAVWLVSARKEGWAFAATRFAMAATILSLFTELHPPVMVSSASPACSLTIRNAAPGSYALEVITRPGGRRRGRRKGAGGRGRRPGTRQEGPAETG